MCSCCLSHIQKDKEGRLLQKICHLTLYLGVQSFSEHGGRESMILHDIAASKATLIDSFRQNTL